MTEDFARQEICRVGRSLFERGYVHATAGNISVRLEGGAILITPTDACLGFLSPDGLALVDRDGRQLAGPRASKTLALHAAIYAANERAGLQPRCVIHTHSTHCVALTLNGYNEGGAGDERGTSGAQGSASGGTTGGTTDTTTGGNNAADLLPPITPYFVMKVGHVPVLPYHRPGDPQVAALASAAIESFAAQGTPLRAIMLARLGPNVWGDSPAEAMAVLEELEETARLWVLANPKPAPLRDTAIEELRRAFGARW